MRFTEPDAQQEGEGDVPNVLSATGTFVNAKNEFRLEPAAAHIAQLLR